MATSSTTSAHSHFLTVTNLGPAISTPTNAHDWLLAQPNGAYTTARTVRQGTAVFDYVGHVKRLVESVQMILHSQGHDSSKFENAQKTVKAQTPVPFQNVFELCTPEVLDLVLQEMLRTGLKESLARADDKCAEFVITVSISWATPSESESKPAVGPVPYVIGVHFRPHPKRPTPPIRVFVMGRPRNNALAKDVQWVRDRTKLEALKPADVNEVLLSDEHGAITEGMSSNFFAVKGREIFTAETGILKGTMRRVVLEACEELGVAVHLEHPLVDHLSDFDGAFITSTSRMVLPIDELTVCKPPHEGDTAAVPDHQFQFDSLMNEVVIRIAQVVQAKVEEESTVII